MVVYPVIFDTVLEMNMPRLAFVATKFIHARTELTLDYNPLASYTPANHTLTTTPSTPNKTKIKLEADSSPQTAGMKKGGRKKRNKKSRTKAPARLACLCGAENCRGWI